MKNLFMSYGHGPNVELVKAFSKRLDEYYLNGKKAFCVFVDDKIELGSNWDYVLERELNKTDYFIFFLDEYAAREKSFCRKEIIFAQETINRKRAKENKKEIEFIPVRLDDSMLITVVDYQSVIWDEEDKYARFDEVFNKILHTLGAAPDGEDEPVKTPHEIIWGFIDLGDSARLDRKMDAAVENYKKALSAAREYSRKNPSFKSTHDLGAALNRLGYAYEIADKLPEARKCYSESLKIRRKNVEAYPSYESRRDLFISLNNIGDITLKNHNINVADFYDILPDRPLNNPFFICDDSINGDLSIILNRMDDMILKEDDIESTKKYYSESLEIARQNAEDFPSYESRRDLSIILNRMDDMVLKEDDIESTKKYYSESLEIARQNAEDFPSYESRRDLSISLNRMGDIAVEEDDIQEAKKYYSEDLEIARQNAEDFPSYQSRRDLSVSLNRMGNIALKEDKTDEAKKYYSELLEIARQNAEDFPSYESRRDLSVSLERMGNIADKEDKTDEAKKYYSESLEIRRQNAEDFPSYETFYDISCSLGSLGFVVEKSKRKAYFKEALFYAKKCKKIHKCKESIKQCMASRIGLILYRLF